MQTSSGRGIRRIGTWAIVVAVAGTGAFWLSRPQPLPVDLAVVTRGLMLVTVDQEGRTRVRNRYVVSAPVAGRLMRIALEPGDRVDAGRTEVARLLPAADPLLDARTRATTTARVKSAEAVVAEARARLGQARTAFQYADDERARIARLHAGGAVSSSVLEAAETDARSRQQAVAAGDAAVSAAEHELEAAQAALTTAPAGGRDGSVVAVRAPVSGVVLRRLRESESVVAAGEPLLEIGNLAALEIVADYLSTDAVGIQPGMPALIERWGGDEPLRARVRLIEPSGFVKVSALGVEEQRVNVVLDLEDAGGAAPALGDGFRVEVRVVRWEGDVVKAPVSALFRQGDGWAVFAVGADGIVRRRLVTIGHRGGIEAEVLSGVAEGDRVVIHPSDRVADGVLVEVR
jgi:HlyD family secretion protein